MINQTHPFNDLKAELSGYSQPKKYSLFFCISEVNKENVSSFTFKSKDGKLAQTWSADSIF